MIIMSVSRVLFKTQLLEFVVLKHSTTLRLVARVLILLGKNNGKVKMTQNNQEHEDFTSEITSYE